jgi:hypothetical protein
VRLGRTADSPALLAALPTSEIVTKMLTFAALMLVAGGLLARMAHIGSQLVSLFRLGRDDRLERVLQPASQVVKVRTVLGSIITVMVSMPAYDSASEDTVIFRARQPRPE